jgi:hypothetical protein
MDSNIDQEAGPYTLQNKYVRVVNKEEVNLPPPQLVACLIKCRQRQTFSRVEKNFDYKTAGIPFKGTEHQ